ncbi:MAG: glycosyltransferase family 4 protein [Patescibacteria group bacterium]
MNQEKTAINKVCFVVTKGVWGGAQKYVYNLATGLPKDRYEAVVVCGEGGELVSRLEAARIRVYTINTLKRDISIKSELQSFLQLFNILRTVRPNVLHLNSPKAGGIGAVAGRLLGIPKIIFTSHGFAFNEIRSPFQKAVIRLFSWLILILNKQVIVISDKEKADALNMPFISENKITLIKNGVESIGFKDRELARTELIQIVNKEIPKNVTWIGTVAELHKNKGYEYMLSALSKLSYPFAYFIIGAGEEKEKIEKLIQELNLSDKVFMVGFLNHASEHLKAFDIFTLTSVKEGLPYTVIEAGFAGVPVAASNVGGIPDIIENGTSGILVTKEKPGEILKALEYVNEHRNEVETFAQNLKQKVEKEFSLDVMLEKTIKLY